MSRRPGQVSLGELRLARPGSGRMIPLTMRKVAALAGLSHGSISGAESGKTIPSDYLLAKLAAVYVVHIDVVRAALAETQRRLRTGEPQIKRHD